MLSTRVEITEADYQKAIEKDVFAIINEKVLLGFGCTGASVEEDGGKYYLKYERKE